MGVRNPYDVRFFVIPLINGGDIDDIRRGLMTPHPPC